MQNVTKELIAHAYLHLAKTTSLQKISIGMIAKECQINRGTFYYHFADRQELINWIFHNEITLPFRQVMRDTFPDHTCLSGFFVESLYRRRSFYSQAFKMQEPNSLCHYAEKEIIQNWRLYIDLFAEKNGITDMAFIEKWYQIADLIALGSFHTLVKWAADNMRIPPEELAASMKEVTFPYIHQLMTLSNASG